MPTKPIGQSMVEANLINPRQLDELLEYQRGLDEKVLLGRLTVNLGLVKEEEFALFIASYFNFPYLNLEGYSEVQKEALDVVPQAIAKRLNVLPIQRKADMLTVAVSDPLDLTTLENLETVSHCRIKPVVSPANQISRSIIAHYTGVFLRPEDEGVKEQLLLTHPKKYSYGWPFASSLVKLLIERASKDNINTIHIQLEKNRMEIFFRVDRKLQKIASYPRGAYQSVLEFIKKSARLDIDVSDIPQSGYFIFNTGGTNIEVGVSIFPTLSGERVVLEVPRRIGWMDEEAWFRPV